MKKEGDLSNREKETHLLASLKKTNCFTVPNNYFDDLSENIISKVKIDELVGKNSSFQVPDHYFETLEEKIQTTILVDTRKDLLPSNHSGFLIPNGYSKKSKTEIIGKTIPSKSILRKIISIKFIRYAAAACILLTTSFGIYFNIQRSNNINYKLSKISDETIESYLKQTVEASDVPLIIENLDNKPVFSLDQNQLNADDIDAYLKTTL